MFLRRTSVFVLMIALAVAGGFVGCSDDDKKNAMEFLKIGEVVSTEAETVVSLWADDSIRVGYNKLYLKLEGTDHTEVDDAHIQVSPVMHMTDMGMMHACPYSQPSEDLVNGMFPFYAVFQMASYDSGHWMLGVDFHNHHNDKEGEVEFEIPVMSSALVKMPMVNGATYIIALVDPVAPVVGLNDITFAIFKKESMMSFPAVDGFALTMVPTMPSMGHGSTNNVDPVGVGGGMYEGTVNYSMTGDWRIDLDGVKDTVSFSTHFEVNVK